MSIPCFAGLLVAIPQAGFSADGPPSVLPALSGARNLGFVGSQEDWTAGRVVRVVWESAQGAIDLNGNGNANQHVALVIGAGGTTVLGDAFFGFRLAGERILFVKSEFGDGYADLDGDGDALDGVLHVFDGTSLLNLGLSPSSLVTSGEHALFLARERTGAGAGTDLNGDGDVLDAVLHHYDAATDVLTNLQLACVGQPAVAGDRSVLFVSESGQAGTNLNGDADASDSVVHRLDLSTLATTNLGLAVDPLGTPAFSGDLVAFLLSESGQGLDANGDADQLDSVCLVRDLAKGLTRNTGVAAFTNGGFFDYPAALFAGATAAVVGSDESLHRFDAASGTTTSTGLWIDPHSIVTTGGSFAFRVYEGFAGTSLNGDGDASDAVLHVMSAGGTVVNLALAAKWPLQAAHGWVAAPVSEIQQGFADRNGDGDASDDVLALVDLRALHVRNTALAVPALSASFAVVTPSLAALSVPEASQGGTDLDGDGASDDGVVHLVDLRTGRRVNTGAPGSNFRRVGRRLHVDVSEPPGVSLNGDGDSSDFVLHSLRVLP